jgi:hypothetical protein
VISQRADALAEVLVARAAADSGFAEALAAWWEQARHIPAAGARPKDHLGGPRRSLCSYPPTKTIRALAAAAA